ncbi:hypothetical protein Hanom_Chr15g01361531 [Helianthus anomalus]
MCSRSVIFVRFCSRCKNGENEKNSDLDPNIQICAKTSVGFYVFLLNIQVNHRQKPFTKRFHRICRFVQSLCS